MEENYNIQNKVIIPYIYIYIYIYILFKRTQYDPYLSNIH